jgi:hypothetical protein
MAVEVDVVGTDGEESMPCGLDEPPDITQLLDVEEAGLPSPDLRVTLRRERGNSTAS